MTLRHPFEWLSPTAQKRALWLLLPLTLAVMYSLQRIGEPLITLAAPNGIVSFELAGNMRRVDEIGTSWAPMGFFFAGLSLGLDYLFMPLYACSIALSCVLLSQRAGLTLGNLSTLLAWGQFVAAALDAVENYALIRLLQGEQDNFWPVLARNCAIPKFALVALGLVFILPVGLLRLGQFVYRKDTGKGE